MKKTILYLVLAVFSTLSVSNLFADDFSDAIIKSKKKLLEAGSKNDPAALLKVRGDFERILQLKKNEWLVNYYLAYVDFILSYTAMDKKNNDDVKK